MAPEKKKREPRKDLTNVNVFMSRSLKKKLEKASEQIGCTVAELMRTAVIWYLKQLEDRGIIKLDKEA